MLLILATVAISMAVDSNGLFKRAEYAADTWNDSVANESTAIENAMLIMNEIGGGTEEVDVLKPVSELQIGDYVYYTTKTNEKLLCQVLYDAEYNKTNSKNFGIQVVPVEPVCDVTLGYKDPTLPEDYSTKGYLSKATWSYNNAIKTLNNKAEEYRNPMLSPDGGARCFGTLPENPDDNSEISYRTSGDDHIISGEMPILNSYCDEMAAYALKNTFLRYERFLGGTTPYRIFAIRLSADI